MPRDYVEVHRPAGGRPRRVPLVRVDDDSWEEQDQLLLFDTAARKLLESGLHRVQRVVDEGEGMADRDRRLLVLGGLAVAFCSAGSLVLSAVALAIHITGH